ncbi:GNAT family N-acetyltransferase [Pengzhenrongella frigida]|uniref:GNAT family N-acetyltransferase n=1 Tax=Pengzhenrongella frigida TaxID=1259133 RepID=UPI001F5CD25F|nr:GNAT family N-acetyltransferase [Cellulomonas sp. HLT2-17]
MPDDADALYDVCLRTGADGSDARELFSDPRLLGSVYVGPYVTLEPERAFVLDDGSGRAGGYVLGALDTARFARACEREWWPGLRARYPLGAGTGTAIGMATGTGTRTGSPRSADAEVIALIHDPPVADTAVLRSFPSHLHIDLLPAWQGTGWGRRLLTRLLVELTAAGSPGVHLEVSPTNVRAIGFYGRLGFVRLPIPGDGFTMGRVLVDHGYPSRDVGPTS